MDILQFEEKDGYFYLLKKTGLFRYVMFNSKIVVESKWGRNGWKRIREGKLTEEERKGLLERMEQNKQDKEYLDSFYKKRREEKR